MAVKDELTIDQAAKTLGADAEQVKQALITLGIKKQQVRATARIKPEELARLRVHFQEQPKPSKKSETKKSPAGNVGGVIVRVKPDGKKITMASLSKKGKGDDKPAAADKANKAAKDDKPATTKAAKPAAAKAEAVEKPAAKESAPAKPAAKKSKASEAEKPAAKKPAAQKAEKLKVSETAEALGVDVEQAKQAILALKIKPSIGSGTRIAHEQLEQLRNHFAKQAKPSKAAVAETPVVESQPAAQAVDVAQPAVEAAPDEQLSVFELQARDKKQKEEEAKVAEQRKAEREAQRARKKEEAIKAAKEAKDASKKTTSKKDVGVTPRDTKRDDKKNKRGGRSKGKGGKIAISQAAVEHHKHARDLRKASITAAAVPDNQHIFTRPDAPVAREVKIPKVIAVSKLAMEMAVKSSEVVRKLWEYGVEVTANQSVEHDVAWVIVEEMGHKPIDAPEDDIERELVCVEFDKDSGEARAPVVTVMGHVDHGKTSLLDYIRKSRVVSGEAGGITQHVGAYRVQSSIGAVTFLDTPGHALFTQMRARGAKVTDIVVLVVAADDGVKEQTIESINHAKAADVPIIVALNKIDKPEANLEQVKRELANHGVQPEEWGGDSLFVPISAATGEGIDALLDALATQAEIMELRAPHDVPARGVVVETRIDKGRGVMATIIVTHGVLKRGDIFVCGCESGRIRSMWETGSTATTNAAQPSFPVEIQGLSGVPEAGVDIIVVDDERKARDIVDARRTRAREEKRVVRNFAALSSITDGASGDANGDGGDNIVFREPEEFTDLNVVIKADVEGSREAMVQALSSIVGKKARVKVIHSGVGAVSESDVHLAQAGRGVVVAFNVRPNSKARSLAESRGVKIIFGNVVYHLVESVSEAVLSLLSPVVEETVIATAEVRDLFNISKIGTVAGCLVKEGEVRANSFIRLIRDGKNVYDGKLSSLYHFKDPVQEVRSGSECGLSIARFNDIKTGDIIECIERTETAPEM